MKKLITSKQGIRNRNVNYFLLLCLSFLVLPSCGLIEEWNLNEYDGDVNWVQVTEDAEWGNRLDPEVAIFNNELYIAGGYNPGKVSGDPYYEDVWKSADGATWTNLTEDAPWLGRRGHALMTFNDGTGDALYMIGGFSVDESTGLRAYNNDIWKSTDGATWTEIKDSTEWEARMYHKCIVTNHGGQDYIYLVGGHTMRTNQEGRYGIHYFNDVWRSTNGVDWTEVTATDFGIRAQHAMTVDDNGTIYIQGGHHGIIFEAADSSGNKPVRDFAGVWQSDDGATWTVSSGPEIEEAGFLSRVGHEMVFYRDRVWSLPGQTNSVNHYSFGDPNHYGTWTLGLNDDWAIDSRGTAIDARHSYASIVWQDKMWVLGGNTSGSGQSNDVWSGEL